MSVNIKIDNPTFLGDMLDSPEGLIKAKKLLNEVFLTFFQSENFCERFEDSRYDYTLLFADLHRWIDVCFTDQAAQQMKNELKRILRERKGKDLN